MQHPVQILLIEDDEDDITFFELALKKQSVPTRLTTLTDGDQVMAYLTTPSATPDLMVLDLNLPRLPGREVLKQVKNSPNTQTLPVVVLSTSTASEDIDFCLANGADRFYTKPTTLAELVVIVTTLLASFGGQPNVPEAF